MRIQSTCLALLSVCALGTTPIVAAGDDQQKPPATTRPPAPPPTTATPPATPAPRPAAQTPARAAAPAPRAAATRAPNSRGLFAVNGLVQPTTASFTDTRDLTYFRETANRTGDYDVEGGPGFDLGAFARVWRNFGLGASLSQVTRAGEAAYSGRYPHPFFFGQNRSADLSVTELDRTETGAHVSIAYLVPMTGRVRLVFFGGPSFYSVSQDVIEEITVNETYPYDAITLAAGTRAEISESMVGFHGGADVAWYFTSRVGLGALVRFTTATKSVAIGSGQSFDLEAGGFQAGLGLRVRF
jgi:hypothetical protein